LNLAAKEKSDFGFVLTRYALERVLYRLSRSAHRDNFVLKGALLFQVWAGTPHRPTKDLDLLGRGEPSKERCADIFREISTGEAEEDGLIFLTSTITAERIKEEQEYEGVRVKFIAKLENARITIQADIGFGDAVTPEVIEYPALLSGPGPRILAYPMETVIAEKVEAIAHLGMLNSRMKDFFDIWFLTKTFTFDAGKLSQAIGATFSRRGTEWNIAKLDELLVILGADPIKTLQWRAFLRKSSLAAPLEFGDVTNAVRVFLKRQVGGGA
jgi:hypothetical protein